MKLKTCARHQNWAGETGQWTHTANTKTAETHGKHTTNVKHPMNTGPKTKATSYWNGRENKPQTHETNKSTKTSKWKVL